MFCGLVVLSLPITIIGANFDDEYRELRKRAQDEKERARRRERALLRQQQQQQHALAEKAGAATPGKSGGGNAPAQAAESTPAAAALTYPPTPTPAAAAAAAAASSGGGSSSEDPIKLIQTMIHEAHYSLTKEVEKLMIDHENKLRLQIKGVLRRHASGIDLRATPLEQMRPPPKQEAEVDY